MKKKTTATIASAPPREDAIQFNLPAVNQRNERYRDLMYMSKDDSLKLLQPLRDIIRDATVEAVPGSSSKAMDKFQQYLKIANPGKMHKDDLIETYVSFTGVAENVHTLALMDPKLLECWKQIIISPQILSDTIKKISGRGIQIYYRSSWGHDNFFMDCAFFPLTCLQVWNFYGWRFRDEDTTFKFTLDPATRRKLCDIFYGESYLAPDLADELPDNEKFTVCNFEKSISSDLMYFDGLSLTGSPLTPTTGAVGASKLKAIKKSLNTPEFPSFDVPYHLDRIELLTLAYFTLRDSLSTENEAITPDSFAKDVLEEFPEWISGKLFEAFLPAFKGFTKSWTENNFAEEYNLAVQILLAPAAKKWMSLSNLQIRFLCMENPEVAQTTYLRLFPAYARDKNGLRPKDETTYTRNSKDPGINWFKQIEFPFLLHWMEFLCAVGIVEIAYAKDPADAKDDPLEGMRYVRLTPLGRYAFGIDKEYHVPQVAEAYQLEYDDANAIITVLTPNCPYTVFLSQICRRIGGARFRISPESLIHGCDKKSDVEKRIYKLRRIIPVDNHPWLQSIIDETQKRITSITPEKIKYKILKIDAESPALIRALTANKEIREKCRFAEGFLLLVPSAFLERFRAICSSIGYLPST